MTELVPLALLIADLNAQVRKLQQEKPEAWAGPHLDLHRREQHVGARSLRLE